MEGQADCLSITSLYSILGERHSSGEAPPFSGREAGPRTLKSTTTTWNSCATAGTGGEEQSHKNLSGSPHFNCALWKVLASQLEAPKHLFTPELDQALFSSSKPGTIIN
uniref:Uncharacterized protein n=1 Tax=Sphaerodactylus townsendi TaxID=933632 RepID=A0ACB8G6P6_9SAUR